MTAKQEFQHRKVTLLVPLIARHLIDAGIGVGRQALDRIEADWGDAEWGRLARYVNEEHQLVPKMGTPSAESRALILAGLRSVARRLATSARRR